MHVGRNDPCPCGSGKKFKHCCLNKVAKPPVKASRSFVDLADDEISRMSPVNLALLGEIGQFHKQTNALLDKELAGRSSGEIAFDEAVLAGLREGKSVTEAIDSANKQHPDEALSYDEKSIDDIRVHYEHLLQYFDLKDKFGRVQNTPVQRNSRMDAANFITTDDVAP
jgi:hypothetical protein